MADAQSLPEAGESFDVAVSGLALNFVPRPESAVAEMARVVRAGGTVAAYVWDYADRMQLMRWFWRAATELDPDAAALDEGARFDDFTPEGLTWRFASAGLVDAEAGSVEVPTRFADFDDYWLPFLGGQGVAPAYAMSLDESARDRLRERLRELLPTGPDGSIDLVARAWTVRGIVNR